MHAAYGDLLGVNELHAGLYRSLVQVAGLFRSYAVGTGWRGCCTFLLLYQESR